MKPAVTASLALALLSAGSIAWAASPADTVKARQVNFKTIAKSNKAIKEELAKPAPSLAVLRSNAAILYKSSTHVAGHFPKGTSTASGLDTEALPTIWTRNAEFRQKAAGLVSSARTLQAAARGTNIAAIKTAYASTAGTCKACHEPFRKKD